MAIGKFLAPLNGSMYTQQLERPYVDDIFDPLFNREVRNYYNGLYGPIGGIGAGYAAMIDNALMGRKGILGPGMGILSTFGRSMDKADDLILGGLTEGVNTIGRFTGNNEAPTNPITNIFVNDYDYQGTKLMAAMGNAMARLTGTQTPLDESDFQSLGDKIAGTTIDLATDPGIMGGQLARLNPNTPVGQVGQILSNYDDTMANIAGNMAFPGGKALVGRELTRIRDFLGGASSTSPIDIKTYTRSWITREQAEDELSKLFDQGFTTGSKDSANPASYFTTSKKAAGPKSYIKNKAYNTTLRDIAEDYAVKAGLTPLDAEYAILDQIRDMSPKYTDVARIPDESDYATASDIFVFKQGQAHQKYLANAKAQREALAKEIEEGHQKFLKDASDDVNKFYTNERKYINDTSVNAEEYVLPDFDSPYYDDENLSEYNDLSRNIIARKNNLYDEYYKKHKGNFAAIENDAEYQAKYEELDAEEEALNASFIESKTHSKITPKTHNKSWVISHDEVNKINADKKLKYLQNYVTELKSFDENIFDDTYLKSTFGIDNVPYSPLNRLMSDNVGGVYYNGKMSKTTRERYKGLMNQLYNSFIPWVHENEVKLSTNPTGQRLIEFADDIEETLFTVPEVSTRLTKELTGNTKYYLHGEEVYKIAIDKGGFNYYYKHTGKKVPKKYSKMIQSIEQHTLTPEQVFTRVDLTDAYSPKLQALTAITRDEDISTLEEFIKLKKNYPKLNLILREGGGASYSASGKLASNYITYLKNKALTLVKNSKTDKDISEAINMYDKAIAFENELITTGSIKLTNNKDVFDALPKTMLKPLGIPKTQAELYKDVAKAVKDPTAPINTLGSKQVGEITTDLANVKANQFAKTIASNRSLSDISSINVLDDTFKQFADDWEISPDPDNLDWYIRKYGSRQEKTLFQQWIAAVQSKVRNKLKTARGALNIKDVQKSKERIDEIVKSKKYTDQQIQEYISRKDWAEPVVISGKNFLESLWASQGFKEFPIPAKMTQAQADKVAAALKKNVDIVNQNGKILKFVDATGDDKVRRLAVYFDTDNLDIKKDINSLYSLFGKKNLGLQDVTLRNAKVTDMAWDTSELDSVFDDMRQVSENLSRKLGYKSFSPNYISHAMDTSQEAGKYFSSIYKTIGLDKDKLEKIVSALQEQDIASGKLQFGALPMERSHLGMFGQYSYAKGKYAFSTDLATIHSATFTQGMLDNTNAQTFFDLFLTDNFKIKNNFDDVNKLKETLNLTEGNLNNLSIVKPRYNEDDKLIGFTRFNKFSDSELTKAFNDDETILVPDAVIGSLDRLCKKDARMSHRIYRFTNKYLTVPFKFGTLANPGFLAGNIQDAYFKQATELAKKYNTTLGEELTNVAFSMRQVIQLNNNFSDIFDGYRNWLRETDLTTITDSTKPDGWYMQTFKKSKEMVDTLTIDQILSKPDMYGAFKQYVNTHVPAEQRRMANLYLFLNNNQTTTMFKNNNRDLENLTELVTDNPYAAPNNIFERIMYGDPSKTKIVKINGKFKEVQNKGFNSYGLFLNNPISNGILKSSNTIENLMRSSTIINDLQHQGYTLEDICDILGTNKATEKALRDKFGMSMNEALNTMYAANFDYDNVSSFMNKMSYILPFPTFYLKNLAFWADIFTNKPQYIDNIISVHEGLWAGKDTKDEFTAEAKGRGAIPIGQQKGIKHLTGIVKQTPYNSMFGAFNAVNDLKEDFAYRTNPGLRKFARHLQDPKDVRYRPYNTNQYQKNIVKGDPQFSELSYMFHQLNPYERFINTGLRTPGKIANNTYQLSDFLPSMIQPDFSKK